MMGLPKDEETAACYRDFSGEPARNANGEPLNPPLVMSDNFIKSYRKPLHVETCRRRTR